MMSDLEKKIRNHDKPSMSFDQASFKTILF